MIHGCTNAIFLSLPLSSLTAARLDLQGSFSSASLLLPDTSNISAHAKHLLFYSLDFVASSTKTLLLSSHTHPPQKKKTSVAVCVITCCRQSTRGGRIQTWTIYFQSESVCELVEDEAETQVHRQWTSLRAITGPVRVRLQDLQLLIIFICWDPLHILERKKTLMQITNKDRIARKQTVSMMRSTQSAHWRTNKCKKNKKSQQW